MILKLMGLLDILIGVTLVVMNFGVNIEKLIIAGVIYLLIKSLLFWSFASFLDLFVVFVLFAGLFIELPGMLIFVAALLILQKGLFSMF